MTPLPDVSRVVALAFNLAAGSPECCYDTLPIQTHSVIKETPRITAKPIKVTVGVLADPWGVLVSTSSATMDAASVAWVGDMPLFPDGSASSHVAAGLILAARARTWGVQ